MSKLAIGAVAVVLAVGTAIYWVQLRIDAELQNEVTTAREQGRELTRLRGENERLVTKSANDGAALADLREEASALATRAAAAERAATETRKAIEHPSAPAGLALVAGLKPIEKFANIGNATARAAFETRWWASSGGDIDLIADTMVLPPTTLQKAEELFARLSDEKRAEFGTPERLLATLFAGTSGGPQAVGSQALSEQMGAQITGMEEARTDPSYKTLHVQTQYSNGTVRENDAIFQQTSDGWRAVILPNMIAKASRVLGAKPAPPAPEPTGGP